MIANNDILLVLVVILANVMPYNLFFGEYINSLNLSYIDADCIKRYSTTTESFLLLSQLYGSN